MPGFILRIDDCGWNEQKQPDAGLKYFLRFREAAGLAGLPCYYGFIPLCVSVRDIDLLESSLSDCEQIAVHGWSHERGEVVTAKEMQRAVRVLCRPVDWPFAYIPPFNAYTRNTIQQWSAAVTSLGNKTVFFGGFPDDTQSVDLGQRPSIVDRAIHLPAVRELYGRSYEIHDAALRAIEQFKPDDPPRVLTLHATWEKDCLSATGKLIEAIKPHLTGDISWD